MKVGIYSRPISKTDSVLRDFKTKLLIRVISPQPGDYRVGACPSVCLSVRLSVCPSVCLSVCHASMAVGWSQNAWADFVQIWYVGT